MLVKFLTAVSAYYQIFLDSPFGFFDNSYTNLYT